jgi:hypothetical protein
MTKILDQRKPNWWKKLRHGDSYQIAGSDNSQFKTHVVIKYGVPLFKDGFGKILLHHQVLEAVQLYQAF